MSGGSPYPQEVAKVLADAGGRAVRARREGRSVDQDLVGRLMADMDSELLEFLRTSVNSFVKWDLIRFFHENPHTTDTAENIAWHARRSTDTMQAELSELAAQGVLVQDELDGVIVYSLSQNRRVRDTIARFIEASDDRQFRVKAIYHVLRNMR
jgi:hypothetical protein